MKIEIKSWLNGGVLFEGDFSCIADAVKDALKSLASLSRADLSLASLSRADLSRADLSYANLSLADLSGANLSGANLYGANLYGANLYGANLCGANLYGANLCGAKLKNGELIDKSTRPFFSVYPLGADARTLMSFSTDKGIILQAGCFHGTIAEFKKALKKKHGENDIATEYLAAVKLCKLHHKIYAAK